MWLLQVRRARKMMCTVYIRPLNEPQTVNILLCRSFVWNITSSLVVSISVQSSQEIGCIHATYWESRQYGMLPSQATTSDCLSVMNKPDLKRYFLQFSNNVHLALIQCKSKPSYNDKALANLLFRWNSFKWFLIYWRGNFLEATFISTCMTYYHNNCSRNFLVAIWDRYIAYSRIIATLNSIKEKIVNWMQ